MSRTDAVRQTGKLVAGNWPEFGVPYSGQLAIRDAHSPKSMALPKKMRIACFPSPAPCATSPKGEVKGKRRSCGVGLKSDLQHTKIVDTLIGTGREFRNAFLWPAYQLTSQPVDLLRIPTRASRTRCVRFTIGTTVVHRSSSPMLRHRRLGGHWDAEIERRAMPRRSFRRD